MKIGNSQAGTGILMAFVSVHGQVIEIVHEAKGGTKRITSTNFSLYNYVLQKWVRVWRSHDRAYEVYMPRPGALNKSRSASWWRDSAAWSCEIGAGEKVSLVEWLANKRSSSD